MTLIYVMDPMCSWCYAFHPQLKELISRLRPEIEVTCYMGGLAPDNDQPMPLAMQEALAQTWHSIEQRTGTQFNYDFWTQCQPRRSTYPACRAVITAEQISTGSGMKMTEAIQQAYYQDAKNPSDLDVLIDLAATIGLDRQQFSQQIGSEKIQQALLEDLSFCQRHGIQGFPFLGLQTDQGLQMINAGYCNQATLLQQCAELQLL
ncbi:DsbA family protein [Amphritea sp. 1_MG-2023]|uniref:DsbA family protein n=1 Tax=Amphritea sp. 1_MG-2023 TaxID=3062670 RepID=UPI0026E42AE9|nr:DsbA family protein [Amphritea sp. 1_MG-2023]MDO6565357.1 DsbA family protein [Amphritea sp. 1_MG-2023]